MTEQRDAAAGVEPGSTRSGAISYLHIPALDVRRAARFYKAVFDWQIHRPDSDRPGFEDGTGHLGGAFVTNQQIAREPGLLAYIYVDHIDETIDRIAAHGGVVVAPPFPEGDLWVSTFRDPEGNVFGLWHDGPR
jgi:uncharacterized protein